MRKQTSLLITSSILLCAAFLAGCGCVLGRLSVQTDYITRDDLASLYVRTPDPRLACPTLGQRLTISWALEKELVECYQQLFLSVRIVRRDHEEVAFSIPIETRFGHYIYKIVDDEFFACRGILTYKVELWGDETLIDTRQHQIWTEIIRAKPETEPAAEE